jgi:putative FmdB family regulatory protein
MDTAGSSLYVCFEALQSRRARTPPPASCPGMEDCVPTYEYRCRDCENVFDRLESLSEHGARAPKCPKCNSRNVEQVLTSFFAKTSHKG